LKFRVQLVGCRIHLIRATLQNLNSFLGVSSFDGKGCPYALRNYATRSKLEVSVRENEPIHVLHAALEVTAPQKYRPTPVQSEVE
jgi:hypothetical protein